ncbi:MAG: DNA-processing protein DprA [Bacteroidia bacterium]
MFPLLKMEEDQIYLLALALTKGLGPVTIKNLVAYCGSAKAVFASPASRLGRTPGVGEATISLIAKGQNLHRAQAEFKFAHEAGVKVLSYLDPAYPTPLKYIHNAPIFLFQKGNLDFNAQANVAIVGTRRASAYGKDMAKRCAKRLSKEGINVVSGLAYGIDIAAHKSVLDENGKTTAVLAHGLDMIYPPNHASKAEAMLDKGAWLTEYLTHSDPDAMHFPARNRIIAGICQVVIVIEASAKGGALITAEFAQQQNREVYAVPGRIGDPYSIGCNRLIRDHGAKLMLDPQEVIDDLALQWHNPILDAQPEQLQLSLQAPEIPLNDEEAKVLNILQRGKANIDALSLNTGIPTGQLNSLLLSMEFKDLVRQLPGKMFEGRF